MANQRPSLAAMSGLMSQVDAEHQAAGHVLHRQGGTDADTMACLLRAQLLMREVLVQLIDVAQTK